MSLRSIFDQSRHMDKYNAAAAANIQEWQNISIIPHLMASRVNNSHGCHDIQLEDLWHFSVFAAKHNLLSLLNEEILNQKSGLRIFVLECFYFIIPQQFKSHPLLPNTSSCGCFRVQHYQWKLHWFYTGITHTTWPCFQVALHHLNTIKIHLMTRK